MMTRRQVIREREKLAAQLASGSTALRGSLLQRTTRHSSGCAKCARGEGHPQWVLTVGYPGGKTRQVSLRPHQAAQVRQAIAMYRQCKRSLEAISELNQFLLRLDREESKQREQERQS
jgi:cell wall assembly regulator SMI1